MERIEFDPHLMMVAIQAGPIGLVHLKQRASNPEKLITMLRELRELGLIEKHHIGRRHRWTVVGWEVPRGPVPPRGFIQLLPLIKEGPRTAEELLAAKLETARPKRQRKIGMKTIRTALRNLKKRGLIKMKAIGDDGLWRYVPVEFEPTSDDVAARILERSDEEGDCRVWRDAVDRQGHPLMRFDGNNRRVAIVLWKLLGRPELPYHMTPVMTCGCKKCVLPEHLGSAKRTHTMKKAWKERGPMSEAERSRRSEAMRKVRGKFTDEDVAAIRASDKSPAELALQYNVYRSTIRQILAHQRYLPAGGMFNQLLRKAA